MSAEPRHGPVTMHRAIERKMMKSINTRPPDAPRRNPAATDAGGDESGGGERLAGDRSARREGVDPRGARTGRSPRTGGRRDAVS